MVARKDAPRQPRMVLTAGALPEHAIAAGPADVARVNPEGPDRCPTCGRPAFTRQASGLLDLAVLVHEASGELKAALEEAVWP